MVLVAVVEQAMLLLVDGCCAAVGVHRLMNDAGLLLPSLERNLLLLTGVMVVAGQTGIILRLLLVTGSGEPGTLGEGLAVVVQGGSRERFRCNRKYRRKRT